MGKQVKNIPKHCMVQVKFPMPVYKALKARADKRYPSWRVPRWTVNKEMFQIVLDVTGLDESGRKIKKGVV